MGQEGLGWEGLEMRYAEYCVVRPLVGIMYVTMYLAQKSEMEREREGGRRKEGNKV